jgi:hypothetical protein
MRVIPMLSRESLARSHISLPHPQTRHMSGAVPVNALADEGCAGGRWEKGSSLGNYCSSDGTEANASVCVSQRSTPTVTQQQPFERPDPWEASRHGSFS